MASIMADLVPWKYFPQDATTEGCDVHKRKTTCKLNPIKNQHYACFGLNANVSILMCGQNANMFSI